MHRGFLVAGLLAALFAAPALYASAPAPATGPDAEVVPVKKVPPTYPPTAQYEGVSGNVLVCGTVEPDGSVTDVHKQSAHFRGGEFGGQSYSVEQELIQSAIAAFKKWRFEPRRVDGKPVATPGVCKRFNFSLR